METSGKSARRAETIRVNTDSFFEGNIRERDVVANHVLYLATADEPRRTLKAKLKLVRVLSQQVNVIVRVIANRVPLGSDLFEPVDVFLFEHLADDKCMN